MASEPCRPQDDREAAAGCMPASFRLLRQPDSRHEDALCKPHHVTCPAFSLQRSKLAAKGIRAFMN